MPDEPAGKPVELADCDVVDRELLPRFIAKRTEWLHQLEGDAEHGIWAQITAMLWDDAAFRAINESRRLAAARGGASAALNRLVARLLDRGFVATQVLAVRRLMDSEARSADRQVVSLRRLLTDIRRNRHLITRENYVCVDGKPYDPGPGQDARADAIAEAIGRGEVFVAAVATSGPEAYDMADEAHEVFDRLSGVAADARSRGDVVREEVFQSLEDCLSEGRPEDFILFGNRFIAHAADEHSRGLLSPEQQGISLNRLAACHRAICQVATAISTSILGVGSRGLIAIPQYDIFDKLTDEWLNPEDEPALHSFWDEHVAQVEAWRRERII